MPAEAELAKVIGIFKELDTDGDGTISATELKVLMAEVDSSIGDDTEKLLKVLDMNGDNRVSFEEFLAFLWSDQTETKAITGKVLSVADQSPHLTQVESETLELGRDIILLERLLASFSESERAAMSFESCSLTSWAEVENRLLKPATELLGFLQMGGVLPQWLLDALMRQSRGMSTDWSKVVNEGAGGYLFHKSGLKRVAVYQLLGLVSPGTAAVRPLDDGIKEVPAMAKLAQKREGLHTIQIDIANPELTLIKPAVIVNRLGSFDKEFDELTDMLQKKRGSYMDVPYLDPARFRRLDSLTSSSPEQVEKTKVDVPKKTELEKAKEEFEQDLKQLGDHIEQHKAKDTQFVLVASSESPPSFEEFLTEFGGQYPKEYWSERSEAWEPLPSLYLERISACQKEDYNSYLGWLAANDYEKCAFKPDWTKVTALFDGGKALDHWMKNGGDVPQMFRSTLLSRRSLKHIWGGSVAAEQFSSGGYLITKDTDNDRLPHHAVFELLSLRGNTALVRKLPGSSWPRRIASQDAKGGWTINVHRSMNQLDMITPTTLVACCYELTGHMKYYLEAKEALKGKKYPTFEPPSLHQLVETITSDTTTWHGVMVWEKGTLKLNKADESPKKSLFGGRLSVESAAV
eukprot:TRINITY_DN30569_c0_g1_i1.p1 TRINITY_DN30569_c0_g1~~TRINITY_DN30569_c0_g1_i1.p1  ORF type:complete len:633 (-),score=119.91 TRINITY_DN30569_c0_g1_i1:76-1974(-)